MAAMAGGGSNLRPGARLPWPTTAVPRLHDAPEFERRFIDALRQPLRDGEIAVARGGAIARFPARFILAAGMRPCPCGAPPGCACARRCKAAATASGSSGHSAAGSRSAWPSLPAVAEITSGPPGQDANAISAARVAEARDRMRRRLVARPGGSTATSRAPSCAGPTLPLLAALRYSAARLISGWSASDRWPGHRGGRDAGRHLARKARPGEDECAQALAFWTGAVR